VTTAADRLFQEYADAYARGERPVASEYLERAGAEADLLAEMIDRFLQATPPRPSTPGDERELDEWLREPPLLRARVHRGLTRDRVVAALIQDLDLDVSKRDKVSDYYHRLEVGLLRPQRVHRRVYAVLTELFRTPVAPYVRPAMPELAAAYFRAEASTMVEAPPRPSAKEIDEIDRLFTGAEEDT
jgi:hypothetical protein